MSNLFGEKCVIALKRSDYSISSREVEEVMKKKEEASKELKDVKSKTIFESDFVENEQKDKPKKQASTKTPLKINNEPFVPPMAGQQKSVPSGYERLLSRNAQTFVPPPQVHYQPQTDNPYLNNNPQYPPKPQNQTKNFPKPHYQHHKPQIQNAIFPSTIIEESSQNSKTSNTSNPENHQIPKKPSKNQSPVDNRKRTIISSKEDMQIDSKFSTQPLSGFGYVRNMDFRVHSDLTKQNEAASSVLSRGYVKTTYSDIPKSGENEGFVSPIYQLPPEEERTYDIKESDIKGLKDILEDDDDDVLLGTYSIGDDDVNEEDLEEVEEFINSQGINGFKGY